MAPLKMKLQLLWLGFRVTVRVRVSVKVRVSFSFFSHWKVTTVICRASHLRQMNPAPDDLLYVGTKE